MSILWLRKEELLPTAIKEMKPVDIILDVGCGIRPQNYIVPKVHICCDPCRQYLDILQENIHNCQDRSYFLINLSWPK